MSLLETMAGKLGEQVFNALLTQAKYAIDFKPQFDAMKTEFEVMRAFLADAENLKNKKEALRATLNKLRELFYEADDIMTDCIIKYEYKKDGYFSSCSVKRLVFKYETGWKLKDINSRMEKMEKILNTYLRPQQLANQGDSIHRVTSQDIDPTEIVGLESDMDKIKGWIFNTNEVLQKVGIVGMGGLGKTTIAQKVYNDNEVARYFEKMIWVSVSENFDEEKIMRSMLEQLRQRDFGSDRGLMLRRIHQLLRDKTCLIVMDDVWSNIDREWWSKFCSGLPKVFDKSSCIIITTRNEEVAVSMGVENVHNSRIHRPRVLNRIESWELFCKFAFASNKGICPKPQFKPVGGEIVEKCKGLPLAIKTVGALLSSKVLLGEWKKINDEFHELTTGGLKTSVMASLQLSYDELPTRLKQLLLCFSIYPEDSEIRAEQLVHWWVGEGLILGKDSTTATELGYEYLSELVNRCLVEAVERRGYDGRVYSCKMHDLVRDMTIMIAKDEAFCNFDGKGKQTSAPESRWLGFTGEMNTNVLKNTTRLRALLLMTRSTILLDKNMELLKSLRVLDLSHMKLDLISVTNLWSWISSLKRLSCLNLSGVMGLQELPSSVQNLRNLQILVLNGCRNLVKVNTSITYLKKLIILDLWLCPLQYLPLGLERLSQLQELSGFRVMRQADTQSFRLLELRDLMELRVLRMSIGKESEILENEWTILSYLKKLRVLAIDAENCEEQKIPKMLDQLKPPPSLQELYLRRYRHKMLPKWINPENLSNLQYLCIENGDILDIKMTHESEAGLSSTWNLEGLCLKFLPNLEADWEDLKEEMPILSYVEVSHCFNLKNFPCSVDKPGVWKKE